MTLVSSWHDLTSRLAPKISRRRDSESIAAIRERRQALVDLSPAELIQHRDRAQRQVCDMGVDDQRVRIDAFALMVEALYRARGIELYDVQLMASLVLAGGGIAEMQTGEGKTFSCAPAAFLHALTGRGVHVATPNSYLAKRDHELLRPAFRLLEIEAGLLPEEAAAEVKRQAYRCDITYGTGHEFGFDYLRDQLVLRAAARTGLGEGLRRKLSSGGSIDTGLAQRGLYFSIVDEADNVLLDDAASPLILSSMAAAEAADAEVHRAALQLAATLRQNEHFRVTTGGGSVRLTDEGIAWIHRAQQDLPVDQLQRTWTEYVQQALYAQLLKRDVHYIIDDDSNVQIVDLSTGRIFTDRTWRDGLHQAVEAKEGLTITGEQHALAQITRQRFSRLYERLAGMTGTAAGCQREFRQVYRLDIRTIPPRTESRRELWPARFFADQASKWQAIATSVAELHATGRPVLVGTRSIADSVLLAKLFRELGLEYQLLNGRQTAEEAEIVAGAGQRGAVMIATSLAGRGTDIKLGTGVAELGGLHVVVGECDESSRIDRQLIGRSGRQGDPGSAQVFVSADDALIAQHGAWLAQSIQRNAGPDGEVLLDLMPQIRRIQRAAERLAYGSRAAMLRRDLSRDSLYSGKKLDS